MIPIVFLCLCLSVATQDENVAMHSEFQAAEEQKMNCSQALAYILSKLHRNAQSYTQNNVKTVSESRNLFSEQSPNSFNSHHLFSTAEDNPISSQGPFPNFGLSTATDIPVQVPEGSMVSAMTNNPFSFVADDESTTVNNKGVNYPITFQTQANAYLEPTNRNKLVFSNTKFNTHSPNNLHAYLQINPISSMNFPWSSAVKSPTVSWNTPRPFPESAFSIFLLNQHKNRNTPATSSNSISAIERHLIIFLKRNFPSIPLESMARFLKLVTALFPLYTSLFSFNTIYSLQNNDLLHLFRTYLRNNHQLQQNLHVLNLSNSPFTNYTTHSSQNTQSHSSSKLGQREQNPLLVYLINLFQQPGLQLPQLPASSDTPINSNNKVEEYPHDVNDSTAIQTANSFDLNPFLLSDITNISPSGNGNTLPLTNFIPISSNNTLFSLSTDHPILLNQLSVASLTNASSFPLSMPLPLLLYQLLLSQSSTLHNTPSNNLLGKIPVPYDDTIFPLKEHPFSDHDQVPVPNAPSISSNNLNSVLYVDLPSPLSNAQSAVLINNLYPHQLHNTHSVQSFAESNFPKNNSFQRLMDNVHSRVPNNTHSDQAERGFIIEDNPLNYPSNNSGEVSSPNPTTCHWSCFPPNVSLGCSLPNSSLVLSDDDFSVLLRRLMLRYSNFLDLSQLSEIFFSSSVNLPSNPYFKYLYFILQKLTQVQRLYENCKLLSVIPLMATTYEARYLPSITYMRDNDNIPKIATTYKAKDEGKGMPSEDVLYGLARGEPDKNETDIGERIIGGRVASPGEFPYQVALYKINVFVCGSSLIGPRFVITAGHCLKGAQPQDMWFRVGSDCLIKGGTTYRVHDFVVHEQYLNSDNDIALIKSAKTVELGPTVKPISLPSTNDPDVLPYTSVQASGWGATEVENGAHPAYKLHTVDLKISTKERCQNRIMQSLRIVTDRQICTIAPVRVGTCFLGPGSVAAMPLVPFGLPESVIVTEYLIAVCNVQLQPHLLAKTQWYFFQQFWEYFLQEGQVNGTGETMWKKGDSGGPLVANGKLIGIVSWGSPCAIGDPDVYTNVQKFLPWIYTKVDIFNQNPESPQSYYHNLKPVLDTSDGEMYKTIVNNLFSKCLRAA